MSDTVTLLLVAASVITVAWLFLWKKGTVRINRKARLLKKLTRSRRYWGVTIRNARCAAARQLSSRKFALDAAPALPVEGCRSLHCTCSYSGLVERRKRERRLFSDRRQQVRFDAEHPERRRQSDRRRRFYSKWEDPAG